jgi:Protein of unknown function (DUF3017)
MANRPAHAGSDSAGSDRAHDREPAGAPPPVHHQGLPRSLHAAFRHRPASAVRPGTSPQDPAEHPQDWPQDPAGHLPPGWPYDRPAARPQDPGGSRPRGPAETRPQRPTGTRPQDPPESRPQDPGPPKAAAEQTEVRVLAWLPYLIVLAGAVAGLTIAWHGSPHAGLGAGLVGGALLAAAVARLLLPARYAGPLSSRRRAPDVVGFAVFGAAVLVIALMLPLPEKDPR